MLQDILKGYKVILASQSPRRKMLLEGLDINFEVFIKQGIEEEVPAGMDKFEIPLFLAKHKAIFYEELLTDNTIIITADTIVWHNNREIGKPKDYQEAASMLQELSGSMHEVITGVCLSGKGKTKSFYSHSKVWFRPLTMEEINYYLTTYKPFDKAGSYGIQEWLGYAVIEKIEGSFYNVMGLPVQNLYSQLKDFVS